MRSSSVKAAAVAAVLTIASGCATVERETRIATDFSGRLFNSIASRYLERPTFAAIESISTGQTVLAVRVTRYGRDQFGQTANTVRFAQAAVPAYLAMVEKYLEWAATARDRGDVLTKEIGRAPGWNDQVQLRFTLHSGNEFAQLLEVASCGLGTCIDDSAVFFDSASAKKLAEMLRRLAAGEIKAVDLNTIYK